jgi:hypothetical protein
MQNILVDLSISLCVCLSLSTHTDTTLIFLQMLQWNFYWKQKLFTQKTILMTVEWLLETRTADDFQGSFQDLIKLTRDLCSVSGGRIINRNQAFFSRDTQRVSLRNSHMGC